MTFGFRERAYDRASPDQSESVPSFENFVKLPRTDARTCVDESLNGSLRCHQSDPLSPRYGELYLVRRDLCLIEQLC